MADSNSNIVSIVGILAILILVGLAVYFVTQGGGDDSEFEVDVDGSSSLEAPAHVTERTADPSAPAMLVFA